MADHCTWRPILLVVLACAWTGCFLAACAPNDHAPTRPSHKPRPRGEAFSNAAVERAIEEAVEYLRAVQNDDGSWHASCPGEANAPIASTALVTWAMVESGVSPQTAELKKAMAYLREADTHRTVSLSMRIRAVIQVTRYNRKDRGLLRKDTRRLVKAIDPNTGAYCALSKPARVTGTAGMPSEPYHTQLATLAVNDAATRGYVEIPSAYWAIVPKRWLDTQTADGGWARSEGAPANITDTLAGVAILQAFTRARLHDPLDQWDGKRTLSAIDAGLKWIDRNFEHVADGECDEFYRTICLVEQVARISGHKFFGEDNRHDWYPQLAAELIARQQEDGSFRPGEHTRGGTLWATAGGLLFLGRARTPVVVNKLEYDGDWNNRSHDALHMAAHIGNRFRCGAPWLWQRVPITAAVEDWHDAPILYISGSKAPRFTDGQIDKLRTYVLQGGMILSVTERDGEGFSEGISRAYARMFPNRPLKPCGEDHPVYTSYYRQLKNPPRLFEISNGVRPMVIHTNQDLAKDWLEARIYASRQTFEVLSSIFYYQWNWPWARGTSPWPEERTVPTRATVSAVRLKHSGEWNPEPLALRRLAILMNNRQRVKLQLAPPTDIIDLPQGKARLAVLSGITKLDLSPAQRDALKTFVNDGGTLVVEAVTGDWKFIGPARKQLSQLTDGDWKRPDPNGPLLNRLHADARSLTGRDLILNGAGDKPTAHLLYARTVDGRPGVLLCKVGLCPGLLGRRLLRSRGQSFTPEDAWRVMRNVVLYAAGVEGFPPPSSGPSKRR